MEREGLKLDAERLAEVGAGFGERIDTLEKEIFELAEEEFTIGSPQQVGRILFEKLGLTRKRRGKTGFSTDARVLAQIRDEHPIVEKIESWRELTKLKNTYLDSLPDLIDPETGRVHTTFNQAATTTGRLSSTNPNLQNIPIRTEIGRPVRACFVAEQGARLLSADYSQVELRVLAHVADEEVLKEIFRAGEDVHAATAAEVFEIARDEVDVGQRSKAKMVNFGIVYGLTGFGLADRLNIPRKEGEEFVARYLERFPAVRAFREQVIERAQEEGYVTTLMGRRRPIPELRSGNPNTRRLGERLAVNTVIQGTAADIIKVAMVRCQRALREAGAETRLVLQIHDELLFEGPPGEMEAAAELVRARDVRRLPARPAARGRRRRRPGLARRQVDGSAGPRRVASCRSRAPSPELSLEPPVRLAVVDLERSLAAGARVCCRQEPRRRRRRPARIGAANRPEPASGAGGLAIVADPPDRPVAERSAAIVVAGPEAAPIDLGRRSAAGSPLAASRSPEDPPAGPSSPRPATDGAVRLRAPARRSRRLRRLGGPGRSPSPPRLLDRDPGADRAGDQHRRHPDLGGVPPPSPPRAAPPAVEAPAPAAIARPPRGLAAVLGQHAQQRQRDQQPEAVAQGLAGAVDRLPRGAAAEPERRGDLLVAQPFQLAHHDRRPLRLRQRRAGARIRSASSSRRSASAAALRAGRRAPRSAPRPPAAGRAGR